MRRVIPTLIALVWTAAACAAGKLEFGPLPHWVKPLALPATPTATQAPVRILLLDRQIELSPGTVKEYFESAFRIQAPQGLSQVGTLPLVWNPDTDVVIVHKVQILRGGKVIDVLASGQKFTVARREANLAYASLDDVLTAILQPTDLRVGDILDLAYTIERTDPVLAGTSEAEVEVSPALPISELHISARWPETDPVKWQASPGITGLRQLHEGGSDGVEVDMRHVQPILQPTGAPPRYLIDRRIEFSSFGSWAQVAQRLAPLFETAARLEAGSPLVAQIARIRKASADPLERAATALELVENEVRYVFLGMGDDGLVPASADLTWSRRFGDCKGKTVLLLALLHGLGIEAVPVLVSAVQGYGLDQRLPGIQPFDHVLVRAQISGTTYWLDGTRMGDESLVNLTVPYYHWGLPLVAGAQLVRLVPPPAAAPLLATTVRIDETGGIARPAPFHLETDYHGDAGILMHLRLANLTPQQLDAGLRSFWRAQYEYVDVSSVAASYDGRSATERLTMDGTAHLDWSGGELAVPDVAIGYDADFTRVSGPEASAPFAVAYPSYVMNTVTIDLPRGGTGFTVGGPDVDRTVAGVEYRRQAKIAGGVFTATASARSLVTEFPASEAGADQKALRAMAKEALDLAAPEGHAPNPVERSWGVATTYGSASDFDRAGSILEQHTDYAAATEDYDTALAFDARDSWAIADRGTVYQQEGHIEKASKDFVAALADDPHNWVALNGSASVAFAAGRNADAIAGFTAALRENPQDEYAWKNLGVAYWRVGKLKEALASLDHALSPTAIFYMARASNRRWSDVAGRRADLKKALALDPSSGAALVMLAKVQISTGRYQRAAAMLSSALAKYGNSVPMVIERGIAYEKSGRDGLANRDFASAQRQLRTPAGFNNMCWALATANIELKRALGDCNAALALAPENPLILDSRGFVLMRLGRYREAIASYDSALKLDSLASQSLYGRGICELRQGEVAQGRADIERAAEFSYAVAGQFAHYGVRP